MSFQPEKALTHRIVMLEGNEEAWRQTALQELLDAAKIEKDDFDLQTFNGDESGPKDWFAAAGTSPFLSERRTVIVRHLLRCGLEDLASSKPASLPQTALVILVADDEGGDDNKQNRLKTLRKNWAKAIKDAGGAVFLFEPDARAVREELKRSLTKSGKSMTEQAIGALIEMTGGSYSRAIDELQKLELYVGDQPQIRESDVRRLVVASREWNVYKMVDAVFFGQMPDALAQLRVLIGSQTKPEDAAFSRILPTISRHLRLLWQARACVEAKCSNPNFAPEALARVFPEKHSIAKEQPYRLGSLMNTASRLQFKQIEQCFAIVADTDARLKGGLSAFSSLDTLERMLLEMSAAVTPHR